jgi:hypothetical protein
MNNEKLIYKIVIMESLDDRAKYVAHVFSGEQVIDRVSARTMATLLFHVRKTIAEAYAPQTKPARPQTTNSEAPKPTPKPRKKKPTATTAPVVSNENEPTETEANE